jgi:curved DNA-binding protein CbpA
VLKDENKRKRYDQFGHAGVGSSAASGGVPPGYEIYSVVSVANKAESMSTLAMSESVIYLKASLVAVLVAVAKNKQIVGVMSKSTFN